VHKITLRLVQCISMIKQMKIRLERRVARKTRTKILVGRQIGWPRRRWTYNNGTDFKETVCKRVDWIYLAHIRVIWRAFVNMVVNLRDT